MKIYIASLIGKEGRISKLAKRSILEESEFFAKKAQILLENTKGICEVEPAEDYMRDLAIASDLVEEATVKIKIKKALRIAKGLTWDACTTGNPMLQNQADELLSEVWAESWPLGWNTLDERLRVLDTGLIEMGYMYLAGETELSWIDYLRQRIGTSYEDMMTKGGYSIEVDYLVYRSSELLKLAAADHDRQMLAVARKILQQEEKLMPPGGWIGYEKWHLMWAWAQFIWLENILLAATRK